MFGLSFGMSKEKGSSKSNITKNETTNQQKSGAQSESSVGQSSTTTSGTSSSTGTSTTSQNTNQVVTNTGSQTQNQTSQSLSDPILQGMDSGIMRLIGQIFDPNTGDRAMLSRGMSQMGDFDVDSFVEGTLRAAQQKEGTQLGSAIRGLFNMVGGTGEENSMSALMGEQMRLDSADRMAGVRSSAEAAAQQILQGGLAAATGAANASTQGLAQILNAIKGGRTTEAGTTVDQATQGTTGTTTGTTQTSEQRADQQTQLSTQMQEVLTVINELLKGTTNTTATEDTKTKGSKMGGGLSLSI